jgi:spermidine synthase
VTRIRDRFRAGALYLVAVAMGSLVMAVEILGTRVIGALYGSSLYVWGALISVTLVALAAGYFAGGVVADRAPKAWILYAILLLGGLATLAVPSLSGLMLPCYQALGLRAGALASAALLFLLPLMLLGMTGPFVIRLLARDVARSGRTAGAVYALSTLGSVAGTLGTAFFLIPAVGTPLAMRLVGAAVVAVAALGLALERGAAGLAAFLCLLPAAFRPTDPPRDQRIPLRDADGNPFDIVYRDESAYGKLVVLETVDERLLLADGILQTGVPAGHYELEKARLLVERGYYLELLPYLTERPEGKRALVIGLAGGLLPALLRLHGIETQAVEIDPKMAAIARRFFGYDGAVAIRDGRRFVEDATETFDFCALDAYAADVLPPHLVTQEMFEAVRRRLAPAGILGIHLIGDPEGFTARSVFRTLRAVFPAVWAYRSGDGPGVQPLFYFAAAAEPALSRRWMFDFPPERGVAQLPYHLQRRRIELDPGAGIVLTDAYNPVDLARAPEALAWRERTLRALGLKAWTY